MSSMEFPLVVFTILGQASIGLTMMASLRAPAEGQDPGPRGFMLPALVMLAVGLFASLFHLGDPLGAPRALVNLATSWLSWEIVGFMLFGAALVLGLIKGGLIFVRLAAALGLLALLFSGLAYAPPSFPALSNALPFVFFTLSAVILGSGLAAYFVGPDLQLRLTGILKVSLILGLLLNLIIPCVWLTGGAIMQATAQAWLSSSMYWGRIGIGLVLPLAVILATRRIPGWLPVALVIGEVLGRLVFFALTVHTATNIGNLY